MTSQDEGRSWWDRPATNALDAAQDTPHEQLDQAAAHAWLRMRLGSAPDWLDALDAGTRRYTEPQVKYLCAEAYVLGRYHLDEDLAEVQHCWGLHDPRLTYEKRLANRLAEMAESGTKLAMQLLVQHGRAPWPYRGGPVDWETGRPLLMRGAET